MKKILVVEDEEVILELLQSKLIKEGYQLETARDGYEGLDKIRHWRPDLVLLDIVMPRMDGFGVIEAMQKDKDLKHIPVIIISNSGQPVELDRAKELGVKDWLIKTDFEPQEVIEKIKRQLE